MQQIYLQSMPGSCLMAGTMGLGDVRRWYIVLVGSVNTSSSYCSETTFFFPATTAGSFWNSFSKWQMVNWRKGRREREQSILRIVFVAYHLLTGFSDESMKYILMTISNSPQPVSFISYGGFVKTISTQICIIKHGISKFLTHFSWDQGNSRAT